MTLLVCLFAAVAATVAWYRNLPADDMSLTILCWLFWGASIMWFVDAIAEYLSMGVMFFEVTSAEVLSDTVLGLAVVALGLVIWVVHLLVTDPKGVIRASLLRFGA